MFEYKYFFENVKVHQHYKNNKSKKSDFRTQSLAETKNSYFRIHILPKEKQTTEKNNSQSLNVKCFTFINYL